MEKEFVPYELAVKLKALGFDEPCLAFYDSKVTNQVYYNNVRNGSGDYEPFKNTERLKWFGAPLYQQAFRWFREKYDLFTHIEKGENPINFYPIIDNVSHKYNPKLWFDTYEEAELACLTKLIEIVEGIESQK